MDYWIPEFQRLDAANQVPNLTILWLPNDHTAGTTKGQPFPINYQADNDLALGRLVEAISHSKVWAQSAIFVEEDVFQEAGFTVSTTSEEEEDKLAVFRDFVNELDF